MQTKIYKWENGRVVEVNSVKEAKIKPLQPHEINKKYEQERKRADKEKKE